MADAFEYCCNSLKIDDFKNVEHKAKFFRYINKYLMSWIQEILIKSEFKKPLFPNRKIYIKMFIKQSIEYIKKIKVPVQNSPNMFESVITFKRNTGFMGLIRLFA